MTLPEDTDETHRALWSSIQTLTTSVTNLAGLLRWGLTLLVPLMLALLGYSYAIERGLSAAKVESATVVALQKAVKEDLNDKYARHLPVHERVDTRLRDLEIRLWYSRHEEEPDE